MSPPDESSIPADVLEVFAAEAEDHLLTVSRTLPVLERQPDSKEHLQEVRRAVHTLKGAAASVGLAPLAALAHRAEDLLDLMYDGDRPVAADEIALLYSAHSVLEDLAAGRATEAALGELYPRLAAAVAAARAAAPDRPAAVDDDAHVPDPEPAPPVVPPVAAAPAEAGRDVGQNLRVPIGRIDDVVKLVGELVISRSGFEQQLGRFARLVQELRLGAERLHRATARLESQYEARTLTGGHLSPSSFPVNRLAVFGGHGFDDLEFDRYTDFHLVARELTEASTDVGTIAGELAGLSGDFDGYVVRQSRLTGEVQDKLTRVRMVPLVHLANRLHRTVRHTAAAVGKRAELVLEGGDTHLDKTVLEEMSEPLLHLLRNAVDHGLEDAEARIAAGKSASGTVRVTAFAEGTQVVIRVGDDGRGIEPEAVRASAVAKGYFSEDDAARLTREELFAQLFRPGFSTAGRITEVSGRGVGLDAVRTMVMRLKGTVGVASEPGRGTTFTVRLPLTLAVLRALVVKAAGQSFAVPLGSVTQILRPDAADAATVGEDAVLRVAGETLPRVALAAKLGLRGAPGPRPPVVVVSAGDHRYAVEVDEIVGGREVVVKTLGSHVGRAPGIAGATLTGDGTVVLILDPADLFADPRAAAEPTTPDALPQRAEDAAFTVLVVDDSPSVRRVVSGQLAEDGIAVVTARDGLDALEALHRLGRLPDAVLTDIEMPRMDGYELLSTLRADPAYRGLRVVVLTSRAGEKHRRKAADLGANAYLVKPYQPAELVRSLRGAAVATV